MITRQDQKNSPMMEQWQTCKNQVGEALLFFRMGDFYEAFYDDAIKMSQELELTLTKRQEIPMCGVPHHTSEAYIDRLIAKGYRVAIAEQMEDAKVAKGLVKREVTRIVTPGSIIHSSLLTENTNNFIASVSRVGEFFGLAVLDLTTAEFCVMEVNSEQALSHEIFRLNPAELVVAPRVLERFKSFFDTIRKSSQMMVSRHEDWHFDHQPAHDFLMHHFRVKSLDGFGLSGMIGAINAAGALLSYIQDILNVSIDHITQLHLHLTSQYMAIDQSTCRHLELLEPLQGGIKRHTLLNVLDQTHTPMGARLLKQWIKQPLLNIEVIQARQEAVNTFYENQTLLTSMSTTLHNVRDLERLIMKITSGYATPRDLVALKNSFLALPQLKLYLKQIIASSTLLSTEELLIEVLPELVHAITSAIVEDPPAKLSDGNVFKPGYCQELDKLKELGKNSQEWLSTYQIDLKEKTGIKTLKVGMNRISGYYIEVSKLQSEKMPENFQRRQTLVNAERYITPELKAYEYQMLHAEERVTAIEQELFSSLREKINAYSLQIRTTAQVIARIDCYMSLASVAREYHYVRPSVEPTSHIQIIDGRHPVVEAAHFSNLERFIPNDTFLNDDSTRLLVITGPNMAGKSTYIRQVALIVIMAQIGSFVPASKAHIGIVDKVFSRIGASDDLSRGQSTFMVEMVETANILNNATSKSLVILDEIGRGTSTYDGIAIAWSVAEYLLTCDGRQAKTLFATHYWELTKLEEKVPGAVNYHVAVHEKQGDIVLLRKIVRGGTDKSYGIHVGSLAGLPKEVISRAEEILAHLEENANRKAAFEPAPAKITPPKAKKKSISSTLQLTF